MLFCRSQRAACPTMLLFYLCICNRRCQHDPYGLGGLGFKVPKFIVFVAFSRDFVSQKYTNLISTSTSIQLSISFDINVCSPSPRNIGHPIPTCYTTCFPIPTWFGFENYEVLGSLKFQAYPSFWVHPNIRYSLNTQNTGNTRHTRKYPRVNKVPGNV